MKGKLVKASYSIGIVLDYKQGYHLRDSITGLTRYIEDPLCRVYWLFVPKLGIPLFSATEEIINEFEHPNRLSFGFGTCLKNVEFIEELDIAVNHEEWFFAKHFVVVE